LLLFFHGSVALVYIQTDAHHCDGWGNMATEGGADGSLLYFTLDLIGGCVRWNTIVSHACWFFVMFVSVSRGQRDLLDLSSP
jgi:hypothetical protein